jgi:hypothetical protein
MNTPMIDRAMAQIRNEEWTGAPVMPIHNISDNGDEIEISSEAVIASESAVISQEKWEKLGETADNISRYRLIKSITHSLECLAEDDPQPAIRAALDAVRAIK